MYIKVEARDGSNVKQPESDPASPGSLNFSHNDASYEHNHDADDGDHCLAPQHALGGITFQAGSTRATSSCDGIL